jgi:hypothetical protein
MATALRSVDPDGIQIVTGCEPWEATAMAIGLVGLECAMVATAGTKAYRQVARFANPVLIVAFLWSAGLDAFAFSASGSICSAASYSAATACLRSSVSNSFVKSCGGSRRRRSRMSILSR